MRLPKPKPRKFPTLPKPIYTIWTLHGRGRDKRYLLKDEATGFLLIDSTTGLFLIEGDD